MADGIPMPRSGVWHLSSKTDHRWNRTGQYCPGIGKGPLIQIGTAMEMADEHRRAYPNDYPPVV